MLKMREIVLERKQTKTAWFRMEIREKYKEKKETYQKYKAMRIAGARENYQKIQNEI